MEDVEDVEEEEEEEAERFGGLSKVAATEVWAKEAPSSKIMTAEPFRVNPLDSNLLMCSGTVFGGEQISTFGEGTHRL